ncbi:hypothetical protein JCM10449v2_003283 [Rhodotorula kratochvilovae]
MLDTLPDEVILLVLEHLAPKPLVLSGYFYDQITLRALCLASRRYRRLAQPVLWRNVAFTDSTRYGKFVRLKGVDALRDHVRYLVVQPVRRWEDDHDHVIDPAKFYAILPLHPNLAGLRLYGSNLFRRRDCFDLESLRANHHLRRLSLIDLDCAGAANLPQLEQLHLDYVAIEPAELTSWLDSAYLPRLVALHLGMLYEPSVGYHYIPSPPPFLAQLEIFQAPDAQTVDAAEFASPPVPPVALLSSCPWADLPRHVLIVSEGEDDFDPIPDFLHNQASQLDTAAPLRPREPSSLWLPHFVRVAASKSPEAQRALDTLGEACARAGRRLMWWEGELAEGELVSHEFWQYARELKAARATGA